MESVLYDCPAHCRNIAFFHYFFGSSMDKSMLHGVCQILYYPVQHICTLVGVATVLVNPNPPPRRHLTWMENALMKQCGVCQRLKLLTPNLNIVSYISREPDFYPLIHYSAIYRANSFTILSSTKFPACVVTTLTGLGKVQVAVVVHAKACTNSL